MTAEKEKNLTQIFEFKDAKYNVVDFSQKELLTEEEKSVVDGKFIIGRVSGPSFIPDGISRNDRFYPKELWMKVLDDPETKTRLSEKTMFGSIGHKEEEFSDSDLRNGEASHIVTKLWIDPASKMGMSEMLILGTPTGQILLTALKAGSKLRVSTRAYGDYKANEFHEGMPIVDPDSYKFMTIDWVISPGFIQARPTLKEKLDKNLNSENNHMENSESKVLSETFNMLREQNETLKAKNESLLAESNAVNAKLTKVVQEATGVISNYKKLVGNPRKVQEGLKAFGFKSVEAMVEGCKIPNVKAILDFVSGKKLKLETLQGIESLISSKNEGRVDLSNAHRIIKARLEAKDKKIEKAKKILEKYLSYGTTADLEDVYKVLEKYNSLGSIPDLVRVLEACKEKLTIAKKQNISSFVEGLSRQSGLPIEDVASMIKKQGLTETKKILAKLAKPVVETKKPTAVKATEVKSENKAASFFESVKKHAPEVAPITENSGITTAAAFFKSIKK